MPGRLCSKGRGIRGFAILLASIWLALPAPAAANSPNPNQPTISVLNVVIRQLFNRAAEEASVIGTLARGLYGREAGGDVYWIAFSGERGDGAYRIDRQMDWINSLTPNRRWNHWWQSTRDAVAAEEAELHQRLVWMRDLWTAYDALRLLRAELKGPEEPEPERPGRAQRGTPPVHIPSAHTKGPPRIDVKQPMPRPRPGGKY